MGILPANQACKTYGDGAINILFDGCGSGPTGDWAELGCLIFITVCVILLVWYKCKHTYAFILILSSIFRILYGVPTLHKHVQYQRWFFNSREISVPLMFIVLTYLYKVSLESYTTQHISTARKHVEHIIKPITGIAVIVVCAMAATSVTLFLRDKPQPIDMYLAADAACAALGILWIIAKYKQA